MDDAVILRGVGRYNGDGFKDVTKHGEEVFVWNAELPAPYAPGQYPRVGCEGWSASTDQYSFEPAVAEDVADVRALIEQSSAARIEALQAEVARLETRCAELVNHIKDNRSRSYAFLAGRDTKGTGNAE